MCLFYLGKLYKDLRVQFNAKQSSTTNFSLIRNIYNIILLHFLKLAVTSLFNCSKQVLILVVSRSCFVFVAGIHKLFHCAPNVPHYAKNKAVGVMKAGHAFTIEPMISEGKTILKGNVFQSRFREHLGSLGFCKIFTNTMLMGFDQSKA